MAGIRLTMTALTLTASTAKSSEISLITISLPTVCHVPMAATGLNWDLKLLVPVATWFATTPPTATSSSGVGIRKGATGNLVELNVLYDNAVGISVNDEGRSQLDRGNDLSRNSIFDNVPGVDENGNPTGGLGIDLTATAVAYDGVTLNDQGDVDTGANQLTNFPIIATTSIAGGMLTISGFAEPGARIELFIATPDATGFGEGKTYVATVVEGSTDDTDGGTGSYGPTFNGLTVSAAAITTNQFTFVIPVGPVVAGSTLTATATVAGSTSEFSPVVTVSGISGYVYDDLDNDGSRDPGEPGIPGVTITLTGTDVNGPVNLVTVTDVNGLVPVPRVVAGNLPGRRNTTRRLSGWYRYDWHRRRHCRQ